MAISRRTLLQSAAAGAVSASGEVFAPAIAQNKPVRIGILAPRSGIAAAPGENGIRATQWAVERFNAKGGIAGRKIELVIEEESSPKDTIERFSKLVQQEKVDCVQGIISTGVGLALGPVVEEARALTIYWDGTTQDGVDETMPNPHYLFRSTDNECEAVMSSLLTIKYWKGKFVTVAGINPDYSYGRNNMAAFIAMLKRFNIEHKVVTEQWPKVGTMDLTSHVAALKAAKPDLIFSSLLFADLPVFMKQAHAAGLTDGTKLVFPAAGWQHTLMKKEFTPEGMLFGHNTLYFANPNASPLAKEFVAWYEKTYNDYPEWEADRAYFALASYKAAVETAAKAKNGSWPSQDDVIDALAGLSSGKPRRQGLVAQGPHRRADLRAGLHHPRQQIRLRDARHLRDDVLHRVAEAARSQFLGLDQERAVQGLNLRIDVRVCQHSARRRVSRRRLVLGRRRTAACVRRAEDRQSRLRLVLRARRLFRHHLHQLRDRPRLSSLAAFCRASSSRASCWASSVRRSSGFCAPSMDATKAFSFCSRLRSFSCSRMFFASSGGPIRARSTAPI